MTHKQETNFRKAAHAGHDVGKKNVPGKTGFNAVASKAAKEYGSEAAGKRVAGAIFQHMAHHLRNMGR